MKRNVSIRIAVAAFVVFAATGYQGKPLRGQASQPAPHVGEGGVPTFQLNAAWAKLPSKWRVGSVSSAAVDEKNHMWIIHRPRTLKENERAMAAPPVLEFDNDGNFVQGWGGKSEGFTWPTVEHAIHVDHKGNVWLSGANSGSRTVDNEILKFTKAGKFLMQIGHNGKSQGNTDTENLHQPTGLFVFPRTNELFVSDGYINRRVIVFDADSGKYKRHWGAYGKTPAANPKDIAPIPPAGSVKPAATTDPLKWYAESLQQFDTVHDVVVSNDGLVYVADRGNKRVQVFTLDGKYLSQVFLGVDNVERLQSRAVALSPAPEQQFLYVGGWPDIWILNRKTLEVLGTLQGSQAHHIRTDLKGNVYAFAGNNPIGDSHGIMKYEFKGLTPPVRTRTNQ
jgi:DNA-binding beta-propeller fold protein YncE